MFNFIECHTILSQLFDSYNSQRSYRRRRNNLQIAQQLYVRNFRVQQRRSSSSVGKLTSALEIIIGPPCEIPDGDDSSDESYVILRNDPNEAYVLKPIFIWVSRVRNSISKRYYLNYFEVFKGILQYKKYKIFKPYVIIEDSSSLYKL